MFKTKVAAALALVFIASSASASPLFQVQEGAITEASANLVTADKLTLRYEAAINQTAGGSFTETGYFNVTALGLGNAVAPSQLNLTEGLLGGAGYGLYGTFSVSGFISFVGTTALATFTSGNLFFYSDYNQDTSKSIVGGAVVLGGTTAEDQLLASSTQVLGGSQANIPLIGAQAATGGSYIINYGNLALENPAGTSYFISPNPFYLRISVSGENESFNPVLTAGNYQGIAQGDASAVFAVPEPAILALMGMGLLGMGATLRKRKSS